MSSSKFWNLLSNAVFSPKLNEAELEAKLEEIKQHLPIPLFWLLGKTQSGKTSLIRALTAQDDVQIGNGFQPCTRTARLYDFPDSEQCVIRFLDTRGLGEIDYDPTEDLQLFTQQAHILIVVIKALDHAQQSVMIALRAILKRRPHWPVIVVQTHLHEGYPNPETPHLIPYPYHPLSLSHSDIPQDLVRSLLKQRELFTGINAHFVPVDFTLVEDGYLPVDYGIEALWETIEEVLPLGLREIVAGTFHHQLRDMYTRAAHPHIIGYALLAGSAGAIPMPFVGTPLVVSIQVKMFHALASIYNQKLTPQRLAEIASVLGLGFALRLGGRELVKLIPFYGSVVSSVYTAAVTYALGKTLCAYFSYTLRGDLPDKSVFDNIYTEELAQGRILLGKFLFKKD